MNGSSIRLLCGQKSSANLGRISTKPQRRSNTPSISNTTRSNNRSFHLFFNQLKQHKRSSHRRFSRSQKRRTMPARLKTRGNDQVNPSCLQSYSLIQNSSSPDRNNPKPSALLQNILVQQTKHKT